MTQLKTCFTFVFVALFFISGLYAGTLAQPAGSSPDLKTILEQVAHLDREISRTLAKSEARGRQVKSDVNREGFEPFGSYRAQLHQIERQAAKLSTWSERRQARISIRKAKQKIKLVDRSTKNSAIRERIKLNAMRARGITPPKPDRNSLPHLDMVPVVPPNDACGNAIAINNGTFFSNNFSATSDGSDSCIGEESKDIWYLYTATTSGPIIVDTLGSDFDTILSVHTPHCPGTDSNEIACNDDCSGVSSCASFSAVAGNSYLIRVGGLGLSESGNIQLNVALSGSISGNVTASDSNLPIPFATLSFFDSDGNYFGSVETDLDGHYESDGLAPGIYFVSADSHSGYLDELYDNIPCPSGDCEPSTGTPIQVTLGEVTPGIDFSLEKAGSISGTVTESGSNDPVVATEIDIFDADGSIVSYGYTDENGAYQVNDLPTGTYFAQTYTYSDYQNELYDNIPCFYCDVTQGTPIPVVQGENTSNIDFSLERLGHITGTIKDAATGHKIENVELDIFDNSGQLSGYGYTDASGNYTATGLAAGTYFVSTRNSSDYVDELFNNLPCPGGDCDPQAGTPVSVITGNTTSGINFDLDLGARISGKVKSATTGNFLQNAWVSIFNVNGYVVSSDETNALGTFNAGGLIPGTYYALAGKYDYFDQLYDGIPCPLGSCSPTAGKAITVTQSQAVTGIYFELTEGGSIKGKVTDAVTHHPIGYVGIDIYDSTGNWAGYGYTDETGRYTAGGLVTSDYFAAVSAYGEYVNELYDNIPCPGYCADVTTGTPIPVTISQTTQNIDFALDPQGTISGTITDASSGSPLEYVTIEIYDQNGNNETYGYTDSTGEYVVTGLNSGSYRALAYDYTHGGELYDDIPCVNGCDVSQGTPIPVLIAQNTSGINFGLNPLGRISGVVKDADTQEPLSNLDVFVLDGEGNEMQYGYTDETGRYVVDGVPPGSWYVHVLSENHIGELYDNIPCVTDFCDVSQGTLVPVTSGEATAGIDFALSQGGSISGTLRDATTQLPIPGYVLIYNDAGSFVNYHYTDETGQYIVGGLPPGTYFVVASAYNHESELYQGIDCPFTECDPTIGTPVNVVGTAGTGGIDFALLPDTPLGSVSGTITRQSTGAPISNIAVNIYDSSGNSVAYGYTDSTGSYTTEEMPAGTYFAETDASERNYLDEVYNDIICNACDPTLGTPIIVSSGVTTNNIDFVLTVAARIRGVVRDAQSGAPLSDVIVKILASTGATALTMYTDEEGKYTAALPSGSYYVLASGSSGYIDQLYDGIACPAGICNLADGVLLTVQSGESADGINFPLKTTIDCMFCEDFTDGTAPSNWTYPKPSWWESNGNLMANPKRTRAVAIADPAFEGCGVCSIETTMQISRGGDRSKIRLIGWMNGENDLELVMKDGNNRWALKERIGGSVKQTAKGKKEIKPNHTYIVRMVYDGSQISVFVDDMSKALITMSPSTPPHGTIGLEVEGGIGTFGYLQVK